MSTVNQPVRFTIEEIQFEVSLLVLQLRLAKEKIHVAAFQ